MEGGESKEQAQGGAGCLILANTQSHAGQGFEQLALVENVPPQQLVGLNGL